MSKKIRAPEPPKISKNLQLAEVFDMASLSGPSNDVEIKPKRPVDIDAIIADSELVPPSEWKNIPIGSKIMYLKKDGEFRKGGIVQNIWAGTDNNSIKIDITAGYGVKAIYWTIRCEKIDKIWIKRASSTVQQNIAPSTDIADLRDDVKNCKSAILAITKEIQILNNDIRKLTSIVDRLHTKIQR